MRSAGRAAPQLDSNDTVHRNDAVHCGFVGRGYEQQLATPGVPTRANSSWPPPLGRRLGLGLPLGPTFPLLPMDARMRSRH